MHVWTSSTDRRNGIKNSNSWTSALNLKQLPPTHFRKPQYNKINLPQIVWSVWIGLVLQIHTNDGDRSWQKLFKCKMHSFLDKHLCNYKLHSYSTTTIYLSLVIPMKLWNDGFVYNHNIQCQGGNSSFGKNQNTKDRLLHKPQLQTDFRM